ncbi:MAG: hypothetical protein RR840_02765 [Clostridium sp.]
MFFQYQNRNGFFFLIIILILLCCACNKPYPRSNKGCCNCNEEEESCVGNNRGERQECDPYVKEAVYNSDSRNTILENNYNTCGHHQYKETKYERNIKNTMSCNTQRDGYIKNTVEPNIQGVEEIEDTVGCNLRRNEEEKNINRCESIIMDQGYCNLKEETKISDNIHYGDNIQESSEEKILYGNVIREPKTYKCSDEIKSNIGQEFVDTFTQPNNNRKNNNKQNSKSVNTKHGENKHKSSRKNDSKYNMAMNMINSAIEEKENLTMYINTQIQNTLKAIEEVKKSDNFQINIEEVEEIKNNMNQKLKAIERQEELIAIKLKKGRDILKKNGYIS